MSGSTPLHVATYHGSQDMINLLLETAPSAGQMNKNKVSVKRTQNQSLISRRDFIIVRLESTTLRQQVVPASGSEIGSRPQALLSVHEQLKVHLQEN